MASTLAQKLAPTLAPALDLKSFKEEINQLESEISNLKTKNSNLDSEVSNLISKDNELGSEISNLKTKDSKLASGIQNLKSKDSKIDSEISSLKIKDTKLSSEITKLAKDVKKLGFSCPSGWVDGQRLGCYFVASKSSSMSHSDAKKFCKSLDYRAHLVEIRTQEIQKYVESLDLSSNTHWWIGATDQQKVYIVV